MNSDGEIREVLTRSRVVAVVGASPRPERDSHDVMRYLQQRGYHTIPVNPRAAGETILGETVCASLTDIPVAIDLVDIFRSPDAAGEIVDQGHHSPRKGRVDAARSDQPSGRRASRARRPHRHHGPLPKDRDPPPRTLACPVLSSF